MRSKLNIDKVKSISVDLRLDETKRKILMGLVQYLMKSKIYNISDMVGCEQLRPKLIKNGWDLNYPKTIKFVWDETDDKFVVNVSSILFIKGVSDEEFGFIRELVDKISSVKNYVDTMKDINHETALLMLNDRRSKWLAFGFIEYEFEIIAQIITWFAEVLSLTDIQLMNELEMIYSAM